MRGQNGFILLEGTVVVAITLSIAIGVLLALWQAFGRQIEAYQTALKARTLLTFYTEESKDHAQAQIGKTKVELYR